MRSLRVDLHFTEYDERVSIKTTFLSRTRPRASREMALHAPSGAFVYILRIQFAKHSLHSESIAHLVHCTLARRREKISTRSQLNKAQTIFNCPQRDTCTCRSLSKYETNLEAARVIDVEVKHHIERSAQEDKDSETGWLQDGPPVAKIRLAGNSTAADAGVGFSVDKADEWQSATD